MYVELKWMETNFNKRLKHLNYSHTAYETEKKPIFKFFSTYRFKKHYSVNS